KSATNGRRTVGEGDCARPWRNSELQARARDLRRRCKMRARRERRRARSYAIVLRRKPRPRPGERACAAARGLHHGTVGCRKGRRPDRRGGARSAEEGGVNRETQLI